jgi:hypothetical protein
MRTTQRNFVVEYKNRRQAQARSPSIWGNLDLRAVALQIETDSVLPDVDRADAEPIANAVVPVLAGTSSMEPRVPIATILTEHNLALQGLEHELPAIDKSAAHDNPPIAIKPAHSSEPVKRASIPARVVDARLEVFARDKGEDDLNAVEEENRRLKRLMIVKFRQENTALRLRLKRFDAGQIERSLRI